LFFFATFSSFWVLFVVKSLSSSSPSFVAIPRCLPLLFVLDFESMMTVSFVGFRGGSHVLFVAACEKGKIVEVFEGSFVPEFERMISWVLPFLLQRFSTVMADVAVEIKNLLCSVPLKRWLAFFRRVTRASLIVDLGFLMADLTSMIASPHGF